ncbi:uncharacterized protein DNG_08529 [Cephalotrichum gorgonifer]|uniref:F-box domain-containing protein n=1 Tax=Cephalotrichum gorgonifer TaxID=2041049 RepID=A0AAE8N4H1_9PEZI|nr:uncharacterized protein DNG_08529 [Cephalotrichum gorgonifer]
MASTMVSSSSSASPSSSAPRIRQSVRPIRRLSVLDLPPETQHAIFSHCDTPELISLSVVSRRFHELAAAQLYRSFHVILTNPPLLPRDNPPLRSTANVTLTGGLDTLTTSDYDYARFLRHFSLDIRSVGDKARTSYQAFQYSLNGGRFLNTLIHLALRDAKSLETFKWNIPVELNRRVFKTLHQLPCLNELHIRWHAGISCYEPLRPLPIANANPSSSFDPPMLLPHHHPHPQGPPPPPVQFNVGPIPPQFYGNGIQSHFAPAHASPPTHIIPNLPPPPIMKPSSRSRPLRRQSAPDDPPTLSGFKNLRRLAVLNIDSLDLVPEVKSCIEYSESTLTHLRLSFSTALAVEARGSDPDQDPDATELDDDFHGAQHSTSSRPPSAQKEWKIQEAVLARVLGVEKGRHNHQPPSRPGEREDDGSSLSDKSQGVSQKEKKSPEELFIAALKEASNALLSVRGAESLAGHSGDIVDLIGNAIGGYFESDAAKQNAITGTSSVTRSGSSDDDSASGQPDELLPSTASHKNSNDKPPRANMSVDDLDLSDTEGDESLGVDTSDDSDTSPDMTRFSGVRESARHSSIWPSRTRRTRTARSESPSVVLCAQEKPTAEVNESEMKQLMSAYVKSTRGLGLVSLGIHLIPVKASVLNSALDLHALQTLTLLNVGNQAPLWTLLSKENQVKPLALRNISTDNVSPAFLKCVSQLDKVYEIFMIERSVRYWPSTFHPWSTVTINNIRKQVLKKHLGTLKRLLIRNDSSSTWDLDAKTITLLCAQGVRLEELSGGFHMRGVHTLLQHFAGLRNLQALHISPFRNDDTCAWAMQETTKFFIDSLVWYPQHKLEWLGVGERATRIIRTVDKGPSRSKNGVSRKKESTDKKGKGKAVITGAGDSGVEEITLAFSADLWRYPSDGDSSEEEDLYSSDSEGEGESGDEFEAVLKLRSVSWGLDYVEGVRIFEKEVRAGEL